MESQIENAPPIPDENALFALSQNLIELLSREADVVGEMQSSLNAQLTAVRNQDREQVEEATLTTSREISQLMALQMDRNKQVEELTELLYEKGSIPRIEQIAARLQEFETTREHGRKLKVLHSKLKKKAKATRASGRQLTYTLQYAMHLGHSLLESVQALHGPAPVELYTAAGKRKKTGPQRPFVNQIG